MKTSLKHISDFLFSLRTALWLSGLIIAAMLAGAFVMPANEEFGLLHSMPLLEFLKTQSFRLTWWLWGLIGMLAVLTINTLFCSIESIVKKRKVTQWLLLISPQIIHIGFLFMLLAHLLSAAGSFQGVTEAREGSMLNIPGDTVLKVKNIDIRLDYYGYVTDWKVGIEYIRDGRTFQADRIAPNSPSLLKGLNINVKDLQAYPYKAVLLQISREPGAGWALTGSVLFMVGILSLIALKIRMER